MPQIILLDGHAYLYRSWYAISNMSVDGFSTNALYGFAGVLMKLAHRLLDAKNATPNQSTIGAVVVFDPPGKNFRHKIFPEYKANRPQMPEALIQQLAPIQDLVRLFGFPVHQIAGFEADDVIGTFTHHAISNNHTVHIASLDKDFAQLVSPSVTMINIMDNKTLDPAGVEKKFGVSPRQIVDYLSLLGDTSDNIPGVRGVGPKTAAKWLSLFGSLEVILKNLNEIPTKNSIAITKMKDQLLLNQDLITIRQNVNLPDFSGDIESLHWSEANTPDFKAIDDFFMRYQFRTYRSRLDELRGAFDRNQQSSLPIFKSDATTTTTTPTTTAPVLPDGYRIISSLAELQDMVVAMKKAPLVAFDCETTSLVPVDADLVGVSFSWQIGCGYYVPIGHLDTDGNLAPNQISLKDFHACLDEWFESELYRKCGHNIKYDQSVLLTQGINQGINQGITLRGVVDDSLLLAHLVGGAGSGNSIDNLSERFFQYRMESFDVVTARHGTKGVFASVAIEPAARYAIEDADYALRLQKTLDEKITSHPAKKLYQDLELPLVSVLSTMESKGILIDKKHLDTLTIEYKEQSSECEEQIAQLSGIRVNLASPKQVGGLLYDTLGCPVLGKTPGGAPSTSESVLEMLSSPPHDVEIAKLILRHRMFSKLTSTYTEPLPRLISKRSGRIHTSYHQAATTTGRLSSTNPNLQNIPIENEQGARVREAFIAPEGWTLISADYSQVELRVMAHLSKDQGLIDSFSSGEDIHRKTASEVFSTNLQDVTEDQRRAAKAINFGLIYGMGVYGLANRLQIAREEAAAYIERYFSRYPRVHDFMEATKKQARAEGLVKTLLGRVVVLPNITSKNFRERSHSERVAINAPVQGTAAEVIKSAMISSMAMDILTRGDMHLLLQVHDELIFEVKMEHKDEALSQISHCMQNAMNLSVPLEVSINSAHNWNDAH